MGCWSSTQVRTPTPDAYQILEASGSELSRKKLYGVFGFFFPSQKHGTGEGRRDEMCKKGLGRATGEDPAWFRRGHTLLTGKGLWVSMESLTLPASSNGRHLLLIGLLAQPLCTLNPCHQSLP